jgi:hypothetical protein
MISSAFAEKCNKNQRSPPKELAQRDGDEGARWQLENRVANSLASHKSCLNNWLRARSRAIWQLADTPL